MSMMGSSAFVATVAMALWAAVGADSRLSAYAVERAPVYGSGERAGRAGDVFIQASVGIAALIYAAMYFDNLENIGGIIDGFAYPPAGDGAYRYAVSYPADCPAPHSISNLPPASDRQLSATEAIGAVALSYATTSTATEVIKKHVGRPRPDLSDSLSYPSGHATAAAWINRCSARMIGNLGLRPYIRYTANAALSLLTAGAAWGRVESGRHYVSDVMAGAWVGMAFTDASFGLFTDDDYTNGVRFGFHTFNEKGVTTTILSTTVDF